MNFIGFDELKGNGTPDILYNRVVILPPTPETAGSQIHPVAGFLPGQQSFLKPKVQVSTQRVPIDKRLAMQGFQRFTYA